MLTNADVAKIYDTILCIPGMNEVVKVDFKIPRRTVLLLYHVIERGLNQKDDEKLQGFLSTMPQEDIGQIKNIAEDCLHKAALDELNNKLAALGSGK